MRTVRLILVAAMLACFPVLALTSGCQDATKGLTVANDLVGTAYGEIADARDAGLLTQAQVDAWKPARLKVDAGLDLAGRLYRAGDADGAAVALVTARASLEELRPLLDWIETRQKATRPPKPKPATAPTKGP